MEQNIDKQIEKLWRENPKIPFMQSKEIFALGYKKGVGSLANKLCDAIEKVIDEEEKETKKDDGFIGTSKELIKQAEKQINKIKKQDQLIKELKEKSELTTQEKNQIVRQTQIELLSEILIYMKNPKCDYLSVFDFIDNKLRQLETNGTNDILRMR